MKIGIAQIDCTVGDTQANVATITSMIRQAAEKGCDLVVLPEMADIGYQAERIRDDASPWDSGPCSELRNVARESRIAVICGLSEREGDQVYNAAAVIDKDGTLVAKYRKVHLFSIESVAEQRYLSPGDSLTLVNIEGFTIGVMICYDIRFPEHARALALGGAELLVVPAAWPTPRIEHWRLLTRVRAIENQLYVACVNRVGTDGKLTFGGSSGLIDPGGVEICRSTQTTPELLIGEISHERISEVRNSMPIFNDRRPDVYGSLSPRSDRAG